MNWVNENSIVFCYTEASSNKVEFKKLVCKEKKFKISYKKQDLEFEYDEKFNCYKVQAKEKSYHLIHEFPLSLTADGINRLDLTFTSDSFLTKDRSVLDYMIFMFIATMSLMLLITQLSFTNSTKSITKNKVKQEKLDQKRVVDLLKKLQEKKKKIEVKKIVKIEKKIEKPKVVAKPKPKIKKKPKAKIAKKSPPKIKRKKIQKKVAKAKPISKKIFKVNKKPKIAAASRQLNKNVKPVKIPNKPRSNAKMDAMKQRLASKFGNLAKKSVFSGMKTKKTYGNIASRSFNNNGPSVTAYNNRKGVASKYGQNVTSGVITTKSSRSIAGNASSAAGRIGGNNSVQGRVAANDLYDNSYGSSGGQGFVGNSGVGSYQASSGLNANGILKVLKKYQEKFTYCYEKALITNPNLKGDVLVIWEITSSGRARKINIKKSTLGNQQVHTCVARVISSLSFAGLGAGTIEYPFKFSAR